MKNIYVLELGAPYIRELTVDPQPLSSGTGAHFTNNISTTHPHSVILTYMY